jgi:hypothetical protein
MINLLLLALPNDPRDAAPRLGQADVGGGADQSYRNPPTRLKQSSPRIISHHNGPLPRLFAWAGPMVDTSAASMGDIAKPAANSDGEGT